MNQYWSEIKIIIIIFYPGREITCCMTNPSLQCSFCMNRSFIMQYMYISVFNVFSIHVNVFKDYNKFI